MTSRRYLDSVTVWRAENGYVISTGKYGESGSQYIAADTEALGLKIGVLLGHVDERDFE